MPVSPSVVSVSRLKDKLLRPALTSHFLCEFGLPDKYQGQQGLSLDEWQKEKQNASLAGISYASVAEDLQILCSEASLPGSSLLTNEINNDYTGVTERHAYRRSYDDRADFTFYVSDDYSIINFFEGWISYISDENVAGGFEKPDYSYRTRFPKSYQTNSLYITKFERSALTNTASSTLRYQFFKAFPISINSMPVSYDSSSLLKCTVSFTYSRYLINNNYKSPEKDIVPNLNAPAIAEFNTSKLSNNISDQYYNNFGDNTQNSTDFKKFTNGSNPGPFGQAVG
jgi:hypothetical protein